MHSLHTANTEFHFHGDFSGRVLIHDKDSSKEIEVLAEDLVRLVADWVCQRRIAALEQMSPEQILGTVFER